MTLLWVVISSLAWSACRPQTGSQSLQTQEAACPAPSTTAANSCPIPGEEGTTPAIAGLPSTATPEPTPTARPVRVIKTAPVIEVTGNEDYHLNNCAGTGELRRPFSDAAQISTEVVISDQATRSDDVTISLSASMRSELAQEIELAYQPELGLARGTLGQSEMVAGAYTRFYVLVVWENRVFSAGITFPSDGLTATATYTYTQHVPTMGYLKPMPCTP